MLQGPPSPFGLPQASAEACLPQLLVLTGSLKRACKKDSAAGVHNLQLGKLLGWLELLLGELEDAPPGEPLTLIRHRAGQRKPGKLLGPLYLLLAQHACTRARWRALRGGHGRDMGHTRSTGAQGAQGARGGRPAAGCCSGPAYTRMD